ncbi:hypothetical protein A2U01_0056496, partial [Trifolium medium]|nr:hypothetical protein [Trifolium medium]
ESEEVLEPLEEENQVKDEEGEKIESQKENNLSPIPPEINVFTVSDLPPPKSSEPNPPETTSPERSFFIMSPELPDLKCSSEIVSAPPPAARPPSKPRDPPPNLLVAHFSQSPPPFPKPPDTIFCPPPPLLPPPDPK